MIKRAHCVSHLNSGALETNESSSFLLSSSSHSPSGIQPGASEGEAIVRVSNPTQTTRASIARCPPTCAPSTQTFPTVRCRAPTRVRIARAFDAARARARGLAPISVLIGPAREFHVRHAPGRLRSARRERRARGSGQGKFQSSASSVVRRARASREFARSPMAPARGWINTVRAVVVAVAPSRVRIVARASYLSGVCVKDCIAFVSSGRHVVPNSASRAREARPGFGARRAKESSVRRPGFSATFRHQVTYLTSLDLKINRNKRSSACESSNKRSSARPRAHAASTRTPTRSIAHARRLRRSRADDSRWSRFMCSHLARSRSRARRSRCESVRRAGRGRVYRRISWRLGRITWSCTR